MRIYLIILFIFAAHPAYAYVGPGLGAGTIGVALGILGSIIVALFAVLWYPFKRFLKKIKKSDQQD